MKRCALVLLLLLGCRSSAPKLTLQEITPQRREGRREERTPPLPEAAPVIADVSRLPSETPATVQAGKEPGKARIEYPAGAENKMWRVLRATNAAGPWEVFIPYCGAPATAGDLYVTNNAGSKFFFKTVTVTNAVFWIKP